MPTVVSRWRSCERSSELWVSTARVSPSRRLPSASLSPVSHSADHEPMSLHPQLTGTTAARAVFSITA